MPINRRTVIAVTAAALAARPARAATPAFYTARLGQDLANLDPAFRVSPQDNSVIWAIHQRLVRFRAGAAEYEPDAAASVRQTSPTTVDFTLRPDQMFTGGFGAMTADDVKFSFERIAHGHPASPYQADWANLDRVDVTGPLSGTIVMTRPSPALWPIGLADGSGCIVSRAAMAQLGNRAALQPVGSGPYRLARFEPQRLALLTRNTGYAGPPAPWEEIRLRTVTDPKTAELAFHASELDFTELTPFTIAALRAAPFAGSPATRLIQRAGMRFVWLSLNVEKPPLDDPAMRQAIALGLDVDAMVLAGYNGLAARARALIPPDAAGSWPDAPAQARDPARARALLAGRTPQLRLTLLNTPEFATMALVARAQLAEIGVDLVLDIRDGGTYWSSGKGEAGRDLDLVLMRFNGKLDPNFNTQWFTQSQVGVWNWSRWRSPEYDALNAEAAATVDPAARAALIIRLQQLMAASGAFIWLTHDVDLFATRDWLRPAIMPTGSDWQFAQFSLTDRLHA